MQIDYYLSLCVGRPPIQQFRTLRASCATTVCPRIYRIEVLLFQPHLNRKNLKNVLKNMDLLTIKRTETDKTDNNTIFFFKAIYRRHQINETVRQDLYKLTVSGKPERQRKQRMFWKRFLKINFNIFLAISAVAALKRNLEFLSTSRLRSRMHFSQLTPTKMKIPRLHCW